MKYENCAERRRTPAGDQWQLSPLLLSYNSSTSLQIPTLLRSKQFQICKELFGLFAFAVVNGVPPGKPFRTKTDVFLHIGSLHFEGRIVTN